MVTRVGNEMLCANVLTEVLPIHGHVAGDVHVVVQRYDGEFRRHINCNILTNDGFDCSKKVPVRSLLGIREDAFVVSWEHDR